MSDIVIIGTGGSSKVISEILDNDYKKFKNKTITSVTYENSTELLDNPSESIFILAIGASKNVEYRKNIFKIFKEKKLNLQSVISSNSIISNHVTVGDGCIIMPGVIVNPNVTLKDNVFLNTGVIVEHDCVIGESTFLATGCTLAGNVTIGNNTFIGADSTIIGDVVIGDNVTIGAGSLVIRDVKNNMLVYGVPTHKEMVFK